MLAVDTFDRRAMSAGSAARRSTESSRSTAWILNITRKPPKLSPGRPAHARSPLVGGGQHVEDHRHRRDVRPRTRNARLRRGSRCSKLDGVDGASAAISLTISGFGKHRQQGRTQAPEAPGGGAEAWEETPWRKCPITRPAHASCVPAITTP